MSQMWCSDISVFPEKIVKTGSQTVISGLFTHWRVHFTTIKKKKTTRHGWRSRINVQCGCECDSRCFDTLSLSLSLYRSCSLNVWPGSWKPNVRLWPVSWRDASSALRLEAWLASGVCVCVFVGHLSDPFLCVLAVLLQVTGFTAGHIRGVLLDLCPKSFKPRFENRCFASEVFRCATSC